VSADRLLVLPTQDPKFQKLHPAAKKALLLLSAQARAHSHAHSQRSLTPRSCHMQMARQSGNIPAALQEDFMSIISQTPTLLEELLKITMRPRPPLGARALLGGPTRSPRGRDTSCTAGYVWLRPALSVLEYTQNLTQALPLACVPAKPLQAAPRRSHAAPACQEPCGLREWRGRAVAAAAAAHGPQPGEEAEQPQNQVCVPSARGRARGG